MKLNILIYTILHRSVCYIEANYTRVFVTCGLVIPGSSLHRGSLYQGLRYIGARTGVFVTEGFVMLGSSLQGGSLCQSLRYIGARYTGVFVT